MRNSSRALHYIGIQHALVVRAIQDTALRAWVAYRPDPSIAGRALIAPLPLWSLRPLWALRTRRSRLGAGSSPEQPQRRAANTTAAMDAYSFIVAPILVSMNECPCDHVACGVGGAYLLTRLARPCAEAILSPARLG